MLEFEKLSEEVQPSRKRFQLSLDQELLILIWQRPQLITQFWKKKKTVIKNPEALRPF